jgi:glycosyltransferase involved in cell wall biosynthesis
MKIIGIDASRATKIKRTGTETYSLELIKQFAKIASAGHRVRLYTPHPPQHDDWPDSAYVETRVIPFPRLWTHLRLATELQQHPPNILFVPAHVLPIHCPIPAVVTVHDLGYRHYPASHRPFNRWYLEWTTRRHSRIADRIIADSMATKIDLIRFYQANPERITVVHLGRDPHLRRADSHQIIATVKANYQIEGDYLLYVGTLQPRKNLIRLIKAFQQLIVALQEHQLKLVIAGQKGWLYQEIFSYVEQSGLTGRVIFPGYIPDEDKVALISGALAYVFPSLYEGFGLPILEAMACGVPVLTSNCSSLPEVAGNAAILINPQQTSEITTGLIALLTNPDLRKQLTTRGYQQIENFSWDKTANQIWSILVDMIQPSNAILKPNRTTTLATN